jgi:hypothetical protein
MMVGAARAPPLFSGLAWAAAFSLRSIWKVRAAIGAPDEPLNSG